MNAVFFLNRVFHGKKTIFTANTKLIQKAYWNSRSSSSNCKNSSNNSSTDGEKKIQTKLDERKKKSKATLNKLNHLLKSMIEEESAGTIESKLNLAKPVKKQQNKSEEKNTDSIKKKSSEKQIAHAVKSVAEAMGGDTKQTESELLLKLLSTSETYISNNLSDIIKGMKIDHEDTSQEGQSRAQQVKQILEHIQETKSSEFKQDIQRPRYKVRKVRLEISAEKIDLFGSEPLGIFTKIPKDANEGDQNTTWNKLYERDLKLAITHPPNNYFQQMILWTEQGKVWKFPIDNEQGLEEEQKVYFTEHVFLEKHLKPWCPQKGPLRHFMELVCVGLSKNPYLTVEAKKEHINWYRNYFEEKKQLLREVGAFQGSEVDTESKQKQIEQ